MADELIKALLPVMLAGPPALRPLEARQMIGRQEESKPGFLKEMSPMLIAALADMVSTELMWRSGHAETNPLLPKIAGSYAPAVGIGNVLAAILFHKTGKVGKTLANAHTLSSGTLAGQNFALVGKNPYTRDDRLSVWNR